MIDLQAIDYRDGEQAFTGYLADGSRDSHVPGVLVAHEGPGISNHTKERTRRLAELGYVAFAADLYGEAEPTLERRKQLVKQLRADRPTLRRRVGAAFSMLLAHPHVDPDRTAAIGFCFGGMAVLELARSGADVHAVVGFHADLTTSVAEPAHMFRAKVLMCLGAEDPIVDATQRNGFVAEMTAAKVDWQMLLYGGAGHSFTNRDIDAYGFPGFAYHADADRRSWLAMRAFFDEVLGPTDP